MSLLRNLGQTLLCAMLAAAVLFAGIILTANLTILNPDFVLKEMDKVDIYSRIFDEIKSRFSDNELEPIFDRALEELKPWFEEQADTVIHASYAYLKEGKELNITISLEPVRDVVKEAVADSASSYLPSGYDQVMPGLFDSILDQIYGEITSFIPSEFIITENILGPQITPYVQQARQLITYMKLVYILCVFLAILAVLLLALLHRWALKPVARAAGASFVLAGAGSTVMVLLLRFTNAAVSQFASEADAMFGVQQVLAQIIKDATTPLLIYGICFLAAGIGLIVLSIVFKDSPLPFGTARRYSPRKVNT